MFEWSRRRFHEGILKKIARAIARQKHSEVVRYSGSFTPQIPKEPKDEGVAKHI
jgi:hypothetical protein